MKILSKYLFIIVLSAIQIDCKDDPIKVNDIISDTTSHNYSWQTFKWGEYGSSSVYDVAIINDSNIIAVGEFYYKDSINNTTSFNNMLIWNGRTWLSDKILYQYLGNKYLARLTSIFAFSSNDLWVGSNQPMHWNGSIWEQFDIPSSVFSGYINKIWGTSSSNLYIVGSNGAIAHYNGSEWQKLESGVTMDLHDIFGATDKKSGEMQILAVGSSNSPFSHSLLHLQGNVVKALPTTPISYELKGVWFSSNQHYYLVGDGLYEKTSISESYWRNIPGSITNYHLSAIDGNSTNDLFVVGAFGEVLHFNGQNWLSFRNITSLVNGSYGCVAMNNRLVVIGGYDSQTAVLQIGTR